MTTLEKVVLVLIVLFLAVSVIGFRRAQTAINECVTAKCWENR